MKHVIIGTAGHIDHGKTALIKALTGRETDTLQEEKSRGISINLGFTFFDLPSGKRAGIIDVPGHEKFIKNMLAGVSGIDLVLFVIAADEGIMPQTREHFEILKLLNVKKGIIVLTKIDIVDNDWIEMVEEDIKKEFKGSFLESAKILKVSSKNGSGIDELTQEIDKMTDVVEEKDVDGHFRLPVDRVFSITGFGTVVTGTIISGRLKESDTVEIYPSKKTTKVRGLQVHDVSVKLAEAGQRCAINLTNVKVNEIQRGDIISAENMMEPSMIVDCKFYYISSMEKPFENRQRVKLYHGTSEIICRVVLMDKDQLEPGEECYVQLRLEKPLTSQRNDRFVIRSYSPMHTIGGGVIIEPVAQKAKRFDSKYLEQVKLKENGEAKSILENTIRNISSEYPGIFEILKALGKNEENIEEKIDNLVEQNRVVKLEESSKTMYIHRNFLNEKREELIALLESFHRINPLKSGLSKEEIKGKVFGKKMPQSAYDEVLHIFQDEGYIKIDNNLVSLSNFTIKLSFNQQEIWDLIIESYSNNKYSPEKYEDIASRVKDKKTFKMVYDLLLEQRKLIKVNEECIFLKEHYDNAKVLVTDFINKNGSISAAQSRDLFNTSRKFAVGILEHFDSIKLTKRVEDKRILY